MIPNDDIIYGSIIGIIDSYGAVHSVFLRNPYSKTHEQVFEYSGIDKRWTWDYEDGFSDSILGCSDIDIEEQEHIKNHLFRKYSIVVNDNFYIDQYHFEKIRKFLIKGR